MVGAGAVSAALAASALRWQLASWPVSLQLRRS